MEPSKNYVDILMSNVERLPRDKKVIFIELYEKRVYDLYQLIELCNFLLSDFDYSIVDNSSINSDCMNILHRLLVDNNDVGLVRNLSTYDNELIRRFYRYYSIGKNLISLIDIEDSDWYLDFLLDCLDYGYDVTKLCNLGLNYSLIWNLANCIVLKYDVDSFIAAYKGSFNDLGVSHVKYYFLDNSDSKSNLFRVNSLISCDEDSYLVLAKTERDAKLYSCLDGEFCSLYVGVERINLSILNDGII